MKTPCETRGARPEVPVKFLDTIKKKIQIFQSYLYQELQGAMSNTLR